MVLRIKRLWRYKNDIKNDKDACPTDRVFQRGASCVKRLCTKSSREQNGFGEPSESCILILFKYNIYIYSIYKAEHKRIPFERINVFLLNIIYMIGR